MILLTGSSSLRVYLGAAATTNQLPIVATYIDSNSSIFNPLAVETQTNGTSPVVVIDPPASGLSRQLKYLSILNTDTVTNDVYVEYHTPSSDRRLFKQAITTNQKIEYVDSEGFEVIPGAFINVTGDAVTGVPFITHGSTALLGNYRIGASRSGISIIDDAVNGGEFSYGLSGNMYHNITGHTGDLSRHLTGLSVSNELLDQTLVWNTTGWINKYVHAVVYATNAEIDTLNVGEVVYLSGAQGDRASVRRASSLYENTSSKTVGMISQAIASNDPGPVVTLGYVEKLNLGAYSPGDVLWLGDTPGTFTKTKPSAPNHLVFIGVVARANAGNGIAFIRTQNGYELEELHDVKLSTGNLVSGNFLGWNGLYWTNTGLNTGFISGFNEGVQDVVANTLYATSGLAIIYNDSTDQIFISGERATTTTLGLASFNNGNFSVNSGAVSISAVPTGTVTDLNLAVKDQIGNSGFFQYRGGITGYWDQGSRSLTLNMFSGAGGGPGSSTLDGLTDVDVPAPTSGQYLHYNGSIWISNPIRTGDITNLTEHTQDVIAAALSATSGLAVLYDDTAGTITISGQRASNTATFTGIGLAGFNATYFATASGIVSITGGIQTGQIVGYGVTTGQITNLPQAITATVGSVVGIDDLTGVYLGTMSSGEYLYFNGTGWIGNSIITDMLSATKLPNGHESRDTSTLSFDEGTRTFTITPVGASFSFWTSGRKYTKTTAQSISIPDTSGLYYFYFNRDGALAYKNVYFNFEDDVHTSYVYWNANNDKAYYFADERHGTTMDWQTHEYLHRTRGAAYANGFGITNYNISGDGSSDTHAKFDLANGTFFDEDIEVIITHSATPAANSWEQVLQGNAEIPIFYLSGDSWVKDVATEFPLKQGVNTAQYNLLSGAIWTGVDLSGSQPNQTGYGITWIVATNNLNSPVLGVLGQAAYTGLGSAEAVSWTDVNLPGFPIFEFRPLYKLIYEAYSGYTNTVSTRFKSIVDLRVSQSVAGGVPATPVSDHGSLVGLSDDDHPQYSRSDGSRGFTAPVAGQDPVSASHLATKSYVDSLTAPATTNSLGIAQFDPVFFEVTAGDVTITGVNTGWVIDLPLAIKDTIGNSGFFDYKGGLTGVWDQNNRVLTLNWISGQAAITTDLDSLTDVTITAPSSGQVLAYDGIVWRNSGLSTGNIFNLVEAIQDTIGTTITATSGLAVIYPDANNQIIISGERATTTTIGLAAFDPTNFSVSSGLVSIAGGIQTGQIVGYGVTTGQISNLTEAIQDVAAAALSATSGLAIIYDDSNGSIIVSGQRATTSTLGIAAFDASNFTVSSGLVSILTIQTGQITNYGVTTGQISNLNEAVQDIVGAALTATSGLAVIYDDTQGNIIISGQRATTSNPGIAYFDAANFTVSSGLVSISSIQTGQITNYGVTTGQITSLPEAVQDIIAAALVGTTGLTVVYDDINSQIILSGQRATTSTLGIAYFDSNNFAVTSGFVTISSIQTGQITNYGVTTGQVANLSEAIQDIAAAAIATTSGLAVLYDDANGIITLSGQRATTSDIGLASFNSANFTVASGAVSISAIPTGVITNLPDAIDDTIGNSGFFIFRGGLTGVWNQAGRTLTLNWISGKPTYTLAELTDVNVGGSNPGDVLYYDGAEWINQASTSLGITTGQVADLPEAIVDQVAGSLVGTTGIAILYNDVAATITISGQRATDTVPGIASFSNSNFTVASGAVSISAVPTGVVTNLPLAVKDTIGNSGFLEYRGGITGVWDQGSRVLTLNVYSGLGGGPGASALDDLTDVTITSVLAGQFLGYNGTVWVNSGIQSGNARWNASGFKGIPVRIGEGDAPSQVYGIGGALASRDLLVYLSSADLGILGSSAQPGFHNSTIATIDLIAEQAGVRFGADNLQGTGISTAALISGQTLYYNGTQWMGSGLIGYGTGAPSGTTTGDFYFQYFTSGSVPCEIGVACSDETTALTAGTAKTTFRMPYTMFLTGVRANVNVAPTGSVLTVDINEGGTSILSTKLTIDATERTSTTAATPFVLSDTKLNDDSEITIDIDTVGSTYAGRGLKVWLLGVRL